ncbi:MAG TPA: beta-propeller fold lactonase family protein [Streptosporangiaceae bacterium]
MQTDNPNGNTIVAYDRSSDGTLHRAASYQTGGLGGVLNGSVVDHLASQGALAYDRAKGLLFAVNAGSNTVTVFAVRGDRLTRRQVISSGGNFPVSVDVHGNLVYVLNARDGGSVQGYQVVLGHLALIPSRHRSLGLDPAQTPEFTHTPGQIGFTPDGSKVAVTTKGNGNDVDVFSVDSHGGLSARPVVNSLPDTVPFAFTFDAQAHLVLTEAGPNAVATFSVNGDGTLTPVASAATGQAATCWISGTGSLFYASNAGSASLSGYSDSGDGSLTALGNTATDPGTVDAAISSDGSFLYAQTGANGIVDEFHINSDGSLSAIGSVSVPGSADGEGIAAS